MATIIRHTPRADVSVSDCGSIWLLDAHTDRGIAWIARHVAGTGQLPLPVEWRCGRDIVEGMRAAGLRVTEER